MRGPVYSLHSTQNSGEPFFLLRSSGYTQKEAAFKAARDGQVAAQWAFHNDIIGGKQQVVGKFGDDSDEAQAVGLTKKSERAKPKRKKTGGNTPIKPG